MAEETEGLNLARHEAVELLPWQRSLWDDLVLRDGRSGLPHALMFTGPSGLGKHALALRTAHWLLCSRRQPEGLTQACGQCHSCRLWQAGNHPDVMLCQPEEGSRQIRIDGVRRVNEFLHQTPQISPCQVVILHPAEVLNTNSANALLKTLEEPPGESFLILESERPGSVLPTIRSRCQSMMLQLPDAATSAQWLEQQGLSPEMASMALRHRHFAPLAALTWAQGGGYETHQQWFELLQQWLAGEQRLGTVTQSWAKVELTELLGWMALLLTDLTKARSGVAAEALTEPEITKRFPCATLSLPKLLALHSRVTHVLGEMNSGVSHHNRQLLLESVLIDWQTLLTSDGSTYGGHGS